MQQLFPREGETTPRLRFPEFRDAGPWEVKRLGEVATRVTEQVGSKKLTPVSITASCGFVPQTTKFGRDISGKQYAKYIRLRRGQFAYNKGNSKSYPQGAVYQLLEFPEAAAPNVFYCFQFKEGYFPEFYKGYFKLNFHGSQLEKFITSGARSNGLLNIRADDFFSIILPTPREKAEQQEIADCLSSLDDLIRAQSERIEALKQHKKGLMQQLFPSLDEVRG
ncbi:MAG TPA: restriction endonuclease subunit S [Gammaproteobacteria bacterium]|nr:restriction endonuclease subunit S [Gammaproteobacteria bacterium]